MWERFKCKFGILTGLLLAARPAVQYEFEPSLSRMNDDIPKVECTLPPLAFGGWGRNGEGGRERAFNFMSRFN